MTFRLSSGVWGWGVLLGVGGWSFLLGALARPSCGRGGPLALPSCCGVFALPSCGWGWHSLPSWAWIGPYGSLSGWGLTFRSWGEGRPFLLAVWSLSVFLVVVVASSFLLWGFALPFWSGGLALLGCCPFCPTEWEEGEEEGLVCWPFQEKKKKI